MKTLTVEQQQALDRLVPKTQPDFVETWFGVSRAQLTGVLAAALAQKKGQEQEWRARVARNPLDATFEFLSAAALAFYAVEKDANPKVRTYVDAFYYISTCASVGYADIFAVTQTGRAIAALVMSLGPALTSRALDRPQAGK